MFGSSLAVEIEKAL